jgi:hypothetical protein
MSAHTPTTALRHIRLCAVLVVATIAVVPALVFATQQHGSAPSIRLTRGFEAPPTKCSAAPPVIVQSVSRHDPQLPLASRSAPVLDASIPDSPADRVPEALRGPPAHLA